jgi:hypothetical protein
MVSSLQVLPTFLISSMRAECPAHRVLLDVFTVIILGEAYKL